MTSEAAAAVQDLEDRSAASLRQLFAEIEAAGLGESSLGEAYRGRRGADVVAHLHAWHELFAGWCAEHHARRAPVLPTEGYTWDDLDALNDALYERFAPLGYDEIKRLALESRAAMFAALRACSDDEIVTPGAVAWWADDTLLHLAEECAAKHDAWALGRIREAAGRDAL